MTETNSNNITSNLEDNEKTRIDLIDQFENFMIKSEGIRPVSDSTDLLEKSLGQKLSDMLSSYRAKKEKNDKDKDKKKRNLVL